MRTLSSSNSNNKKGHPEEFLFLKTFVLKFREPVLQYMYMYGSFIIFHEKF